MPGIRPPTQKRTVMGFFFFFLEFTH